MQLRDYQTAGAQFLLDTPRSMVLAPVGAGKTATTLTAMQEALRRGDVRRFLVVAPKRVVTDVWPVEAPKWAPGLLMSLAIGTPAQRLAALAAPTDVVVTNYDNLQWLAEQPLDFDAVVFDELTRLKNSSGKRFKAFEKVIGNIETRWGLTGSFTSNGLEDVFGQCKIVDQSLLGRSKGAFLQQYFTCISREYGDWAPVPGSLEKVMARIKPATFLLDPGIYTTTLPPLHVVELSTRIADRAPYESMKKKFVAEIGDTRAIAQTAATVTGKLQQMSCIAHDTPVLTDAGWVPIQDVTPAHCIWDGDAWVNQDGCIPKGMQLTDVCFGVRMTYNHEVLTVAGWKTAKEVINGNAGKRFDRAAVRLPDRIAAPRVKREPLRDMALSMRLRGASRAAKSVFAGLDPQGGAELWVSSQQHRSWNVGQPTVPHLEEYAPEMPEPSRQRFSPLRRRGGKHLQIVGRVFQCVLGRHAAWVRRQLNNRPRGWVERLLQGKLPVGNYAGTAKQPKGQCVAGHAEGTNDRFASRSGVWASFCNAARAAFSVQMGFSPRTEYVRTYDLLNCGPRSRFVVLGEDGRALIVHNCGFVYADGATHWYSEHKLERLDELLEENQFAPTIIVYNYQAELAALKARYGARAVTMEDPRAVERWNCGKVSILLLHPKSAGHGLNLQHGGSKMVFLSLPWSLELFEQTVGRLHRSGQQHAVWCYVILAEQTIDQTIWRALHDKRNLSDIALEALK